MARLHKYTPVLIEAWKTDALHFLYDHVLKQDTETKCDALMQRIAELEFDAEEAADAARQPRQ